MEGQSTAGDCGREAKRNANDVWSVSPEDSLARFKTGIQETDSPETTSMVSHSQQRLGTFSIGTPKSRESDSRQYSLTRSAKEQYPQPRRLSSYFLRENEKYADYIGANKYWYDVDWKEEVETLLDLVYDLFNGDSRYKNLECDKMHRLYHTANRIKVKLDECKI